MSDDPIKRIADLAGCTEEVAKTAYEETKNVVDAVDKILFRSEIKTKPTKILTEEQQEIARIREILKENDERNYKKFIKDLTS